MRATSRMLNSCSTVVARSRFTSAEIVLFPRTGADEEWRRTGERRRVREGASHRGRVKSDHDFFCDSRGPSTVERCHVWAMGRREESLRKCG